MPEVQDIKVQSASDLSKGYRMAELGPLPENGAR